MSLSTLESLQVMEIAMKSSIVVRSSAAVMAAFSVGVAGVAPIVLTRPAQAQVSFYDVPSNYWATSFIQELSSRGIIKGFPDGSFRPNDPVTRAQFAAMVSQAFNQPVSRNTTYFVDVPDNYWAYNVVQTAYTTNFLSGYPNNVFRPEQNIPRVQALVSLASGLRYAASGDPASILPQFYNDAFEIPSYAYSGITAATQRQIVVNYPNVSRLNPNQNATRADVAAFIYQALVQSGQVTRINSSYIVGQAPSNPQLSQTRVVAGTAIPVTYEKSKILLAAQETVPLTLITRQAVSAPAGNVLIPVGTQVVGELRPAQNGSQFVARELVFADGRRMAVNAASQVVTRTEEISQGINLGNVLRNAAIGGAAAAGIAAVTGDTAIATEEVLGGVGAGILAGLLLERNRVTLISVNPESDLTLTINSDLAMR